MYEDASESVSNWLGSSGDTSDAADGRGTGTLNHEGEPESLWGQIGQTVGDLGRGISQEGVGSLFDAEGGGISGMLDRQDAQRELSNRFQVVGDDFVGPRNHNQVSQEEYQDIARTFSNIRQGRGDLTIDASQFDEDAGEDRAAWEEGVQADIADMMMTTGGRQQINGLSNNVVRDDTGAARTDSEGNDIHHHSTISPLFGVQRRDEDGNLELDDEGHIQWDDPGAGNRDASTLRHDNAFARAGDGSWDDHYAASRDEHGTRGEGVNSTIMFNPGEVLGLRSDVVLDHEMQHAIHQTQGTMAEGDFGGISDGHGGTLDAGVGNRERQAVGLSRDDSPTGGHYPGDPDGCTENTYRLQSNQLGDRFLPREHYGALPGEAGSDAELEEAWNRFNASGHSRL